jgi:hypothetical protein
VLENRVEGAFLNDAKPTLTTADSGKTFSVLGWVIEVYHDNPLCERTQQIHSTETEFKVFLWCLHLPVDDI